MCVESNQRYWPDYSQALTFAYNIFEHSVTHVTPYEKVYGRIPRLPIDNLMGRDEFVTPDHQCSSIMSSMAIAVLKKYIGVSKQRNRLRLIHLHHFRRYVPREEVVEDEAIELDDVPAAAPSWAGSTVADDVARNRRSLSPLTTDGGEDDDIQALSDEESVQAPSFSQLSALSRIWL